MLRVVPVGPQAPPTLLRFAYRKALHEATRVPPMDYRDNLRYDKKGGVKIGRC